MKQTYSFEEFLTQANESWIGMSHVWWFTTPADIPILFFSYVRSRLRQLEVSMQTVDFKEQELSDILSQLQTSFLGSSLLYWSSCSLDDLDRKKQQVLVGALSTYSGPHSVVLYATREYAIPKDFTRMQVDIPEHVDKKLFMLLARFVQVSLPTRIATLIPTIFKQFEHITLDQACVLLWYLKCAGSSGAEFIDTWLSKIFLQDSSLFTLSQFFFARDSQLFFMYWKEIGPSYPETFWVTYWSEQTWRAHFALNYLQHNNQLEAKKIGYRLPFSFLQKDWKRHSPSKLVTAHNQLYSLDHALKNGGPEYGLELFYHSFFNS